MWSEIAAIIIITVAVLVRIYYTWEQIDNPTHEYYLVRDIGARRRAVGYKVLTLVIVWLVLMIVTGISAVQGGTIINLNLLILLVIIISPLYAVRWYITKGTPDKAALFVILALVMLPLLTCLIGVIVLSNTNF